MERISPKKVSRLILQNLDALSKIGISGMVRRSNGKRLIELRRAESDDAQGVPVVALLTLLGRCAAICGRLPGMASKHPQGKRNAVCGHLWPKAERGCSVQGNHLLGGGQHRVCLVCGNAVPDFRMNSGQKPGPTLSTIWRKRHEKRC